MAIRRTLMLVLAANAWIVTAAFGQSVVLSDGGIAFPDDTEQITAVFTGTAPLAKSGQTSCFDASGNLTLCGTGVGAGQEGHVRPGVRWPIPRFTKNGDGTVTDNLTGLIWLEDANCVAADNFDAILALANTLYDGSTTSPGGVDELDRCCGYQCHRSAESRLQQPRRAEHDGDRPVERGRPVFRNPDELLDVDLQPAEQAIRPLCVLLSPVPDDERQG